MLRAFRDHCLAPLLVCVAAFGSGCASGPERNQYSQLLVTEQAVVSGKLAELSIGSTKKTKGWGRAAWTADPSVASAVVTTAGTDDEIVAVTAIVKSPSSRRGTFPGDVGLTRGDLLGTGLLSGTSGKPGGPHLAFFKTNRPEVFVSYQTDDRGKVSPKGIHRARSIADVTAHLYPLDESLAEARPFVDRNEGKGWTPEYAFNRLAPYADLSPEVADMLASKTATTERLSAETLTALNDLWADHAAVFDETKALPGAKFNERVAHLRVLEPALRSALAVEGSAARTRALAVLGDMLSAFRADARSLLPRTWVSPRYFVLDSVAQVTDSELASEAMREKLVDLPEFLDQSETALDGIDTLAELPKLVQGLSAMHRIGRDPVTDRPLSRLKDAAFPVVEARLLAKGKPQWLLVERGFLKFVGYRSTPADVSKFRDAIDTYPKTDDWRILMEWHNRHRNAFIASNSVTPPIEWVAALEPLQADLREKTMVEVERLKADGLIATAAVLRYDLARATNRYTFRASYKPLFDPESERVANPAYAEVLLAFDPPFDPKNGESRELIRRLHELPWLDRGLSRTFGLSYGDAATLRATANALETELGYVRLQYSEDGNSLERAEEPPLLTSLNPWGYYAMPFFGVSGELRTEGQALRKLKEDHDARKEAMEPEKAALEVQRVELDAAIAAFNRQVQAGLDNANTRASLASRKKSFDRATAEFNERAAQLSREIAAYNRRVPPFNVKLNQERSASVRKVHDELDALLKAWFERRVQEHASNLRAAGRSDAEVAAEERHTRWMVGLSDGRPGGYADADGFREVKAADLQANLWTAGDSRAIANALIELWRNAGRFPTDPARMEAVAPLVDRFVTGFDPAALRAAVAAASDLTAPADQAFLAHVKQSLASLGPR